ncbi:MAG TPA: substrate-binding domain-containing protein [Syntrophobacter fumaroxidans]|nr:substrate-binding domain-containing protein [Syntrophobacter fumaroxidans]
MKAHLLKAAVFSICLAIAGTGAVPSAGGEPCDGTYGSGPNRFVLATGSPGELGLVKALADVFTARTSTTLCWKKAGSGESLKMLKEKTADVIMGHSPDAEKKAVAEGWAANHALIGSNEFFIVGPATDPAGISGTSSAVEAYRKIAETKAKFFSRGDNSGTHKKELQIWAKAGVTPSGDWYVATKQFMIATLRMADSERGYFMTDSSTWVAEKKNLKNLKVLLKGDKILVNVYHGLCQPPGSTPGAEWAAKFIAFVASDEGQNIIRGFGKDLHGEGLYNDAAYAKQFE